MASKNTVRGVLLNLFYSCFLGLWCETFKQQTLCIFGRNSSSEDE